MVVSFLSRAYTLIIVAGFDAAGAADPPVDGNSTDETPGPKA
jgi:hypothetical protein